MPVKPSPEAAPLPAALSGASAGAEGAQAKALGHVGVVAAMSRVLLHGREGLLESFKSSRSTNLQRGRDFGNTDAATRILVIDSNDRVIYGDVRDRKGWAQPLSVNEAFQEATHRHRASDALSSSLPKVVREAEQKVPAVRTNSRAATLSPYQAGKANVQARSLKTPTPSVATATKDCSGAHVPSKATRTR